MPQSVTVPEKTLEHWASQYVTYRYLSKAALWWPTSREDINIGWLPTKPGKAIQVELKTTRIVGTAIHDVYVDLGQLWEYRHRPLGRQPFYAFPWPDWRGNLEPAAKASGRMVTELGYARSGSRWWFASWMVLLTTAQVANVLQKDLLAHGSRKRNKKKRLVRFDLTRSTTDPIVTWGSGVAAPRTIDWLEFWSRLEQCGHVGWPQLIRIPGQMAPKRGFYTSGQIERLLLESAGRLTSGKWDNDELLVTLEPDEDGNYRASQDASGNIGGVPDYDTDQVLDSRIAIFLDARALFQG